MEFIQGYYTYFSSAWGFPNLCEMCFFRISEMHQDALQSSFAGHPRTISFHWCGIFVHVQLSNRVVWNNRPNFQGGKGASFKTDPRNWTWRHFKEMRAIWRWGWSHHPFIAGALEWPTHNLDDLDISKVMVQIQGGLNLQTFGIEISPYKIRNWRSPFLDLKQDSLPPGLLYVPTGQKSSRDQQGICQTSWSVFAQPHL